MVGAERGVILDRLPYVGLDIESVERDSVRVEYSPNRPDFGTDFGIARALRGLLGKDLGLPQFRVARSGLAVEVDSRLASVRPFIACATASGLRMDDEDVRQVISLQEDLHNGLGRKRRVVAIGLHDLDSVSGNLRYAAVGPSFSFTPMDTQKKLSVEEILRSTQQGRLYGGVLKGTRTFPVILDSEGTVLSFPPVINGSATKVTSNTKRLFIDVTSTEKRIGEDVLAILTTTLAEMGAKLGSVGILYPGGGETTPDLKNRQIAFDPALIESTLGLGLSRNRMVQALRRCRLDVRGSKVIAPRYRIDLLHPVDAAEEVALGYGFDMIGPVYPASKQPGSLNPFDEFMDRASTIMAGEGMTELMTFELTDEKTLYRNFGRPPDAKITVRDPRSLDHSMLRDSLLPSLAAALSSNVKEDYPQRVYEIGRVYARTAEGVREKWSLACLVAHSQSTFTEAKMFMDATLRALVGAEARTRPSHHWAFSDGRVAEATLDGEELGIVGEVKPESVVAFGLNVPVAGFEVDLSQVFKRLK